jgi:hypothetical protein
MDDDNDARLVADVAASLRVWQAAEGRPAPTKILRETVWFFWQNPRMPKPRVGGKYPRTSQWSREAAEAALAADGLSGRLVIEHVRPMHRLLRRLIDEPLLVPELVEELRAGLEVVVVTKDQSAKLPDGDSPTDRYRAAGLDLREFRSLDEWEAVLRRDAVRPAQLAHIDVGDTLWDAMEREWMVVDADERGLTLEDSHGDVEHHGWGALLTLCVRTCPPPSPSL